MYLSRGDVLSRAQQGGRNTAESMHRIKSPSQTSLVATISGLLSKGSTCGIAGVVAGDFAVLNRVETCEFA